jgi:Flp pilus assembly protein TadD
VKSRSSSSSGSLSVSTGIRQEPDHALVHYSLGHALRKKGDLDGAIAEYREVIRLKPDDAEARNNLGEVLEHRGDKQRALEEYRKGSELDPKNPTIRSAYERLVGKPKN